MYEVDISHLTFKPVKGPLLWNMHNDPFDTEQPNYLHHECMDWCKQRNIQHSLKRHSCQINYVNSQPVYMQTITITLEDTVDAVAFFLMFRGDKV